MAGKVLKRVFVLGLIAALILAARNYLERGKTPEEVAEITFDDGSTQTLNTGSDEGRELSDLARKILEAGV